MARRTTLKELSELLELSISTVSKALSDSSEISATTKARVRELAKACNYHNNKLASSFRTGSTKVIGVVVPNLMDVYYTEVLVGIEKYLTSKGFTMMVAVSNDSDLKEEKVITSLSCGYVDGLIISNANKTLCKKTNQSMRVPINDSIPMVLFGRYNPLIRCDQVLNNFSKASYELVEYLHKNKKCNNIAILGFNDDPTNTESKIIGFEQALGSFELPKSPNSIIIGNRKTLLDEISKILRREDFDGVFCLDYKVYNLLIEVMAQFSTRKSKEIQIVTLGNTDLLRQLPSASIDLKAETVGELSAKTLLKRIKTKSRATHRVIIVEGSLVDYSLKQNNELLLC